MPQGIPRQIGRYAIEEEIGRGGFGRVYRGRDPGIGSRPVAVKVLTEANNELLNRFRNEAAVAGNLRHPNIVTVYEFGEYEGKPFLAMEYLEGETLQQIIAAGKPLILLEKVNIMSQVAEGLYCAHQSSVVHRDVKPGNIMVLPDGRAKIMDFGIAKIVRDSDATQFTQKGFVIGTPLYMSPEQLKGTSEADALCDIFAYGVIYYELITGKHPFAGADTRTTMYNVNFVEPAPMRDVLPDFPDALQAVISRTLAKDRDLRYQSLRRVQFDVEPIRVELQQQRASDLLLQAQGLIANEQSEQAQNLISEALTLDPSNRIARSLWETEQKRLHQLAVQPRIESFLKSAEEHLSQRRFAEAVQSFEEALRLDRQNKDLQARLESARAKHEHNKKVIVLLAEARKQFTEQNLTGASRAISEALRHDPEHPEAVDLLRAINTAIERRDRENRIDEAIRKAEGLVLLNAYDEAIRTLEGLGKDAETSKVKLFLNVVQTAKRDQERKQKLRAEIAAASDLLRDRRLAEAVDRLEKLHADYPANTEVVNLLTYARTELEAEIRNRAVDAAATKARELVLAHDFDGALAVLDDALKAYPGQGRLVSLLESTLSAKSAWEHEQAIQKVLQTANDRRARQQFAEGIAALEAGLREFPDEPVFVELLQELRPALERQRREQAIARVVDAARQSLDQHQPDRALQFLKRALVEYPGEPSLTDLVERARQEQEALEKARAIAAIERRISTYERSGNLPGAIAAVEEGLASWPGELQLLDQRERLLAIQRERERQKAIREAVAQAKKLAADKRYGEAGTLIDSARRSYGDDAALVDAAEENARAWADYQRAEAVREIVARGRKLLSGDGLDEALELLSEGLAKYPGEASLAEGIAQARQAIEARERKKAIEGLLKESQEASEGHEFERGERILKEGLARYPGDSGLARGLAAVRTAREAWERQQAVLRAIHDARDLAAAARFTDALGIIGTALERYAGEPGLLDAKRQIEADYAEHQRGVEIAEVGARAATMLEQGRPDAALQVLKRALVDYPGEPSLTELLKRAQQEEEALEKARAIAAIERRIDTCERSGNLTGALAAVDEGLASWPGEAKLLEQRERLLAIQRERERQKSIRDAIAQAKKLAADKRFGEAGSLIDGARKSYGDDPALVEAAGENARAWADYQRAEAVREIIARGRKLVSSGGLDEALEVFSEGLAKYPGEASLAQGIAQARQAIEARERKNAIEALLKESRQATERRDFEGAERILEQGSARYPGDSGLARGLAGVHAAREAWEREQAIFRAIQNARELAAAARFTDALAIVGTALERYAGETRLLDAKRQIEAGYAEHQRREEIASMAARAGSMLDEGRPDAALRFLRGAAERHPDESQWAPLIERAQQALEARARELERAKFVRQLEQDIPALARDKRFDEAFKKLAVGLERYPGDAALIALRERVETEKAKYERARAIEQAAARVKALIERGEFEEAVRMAGELRGQYRGEAVFDELLSSANAAIEMRQRRDEVARNAGELIEQGRLAEAIGTIDQAFATWPGDAVLTAARDRAMAIRRALQDVAALVSEGRAADALQAIESIASASPSWPEVAALRKQAEELLAAQERAAAIERHAKTVREKLNAGELDTAINLIDDGLRKWPDAESLMGLRNSANAALEMRRRHDEIARNAGELIEQGRLREAIAMIDQAFATWPGDAVLTAARDRAMGLRRALQDAAALIAKARPADALRAIEPIASAYPSWSEVAALKKQAAELLAAQERAAAIERHTKTVRDKLNAGELDTAINLIDDGLRKWPDAESLMGLRKQALALRAARERQQAIDDAVGRCESLRQQNRLDTALHLVEEGLRQFQNEPALVKLRQQIEADLAERERRERREHALRELESIESSIPAVSSMAQIAELSASVRDISAGFPDEQDVQLAASGPKAHLADIENTRRALDGGDIDAASSVCERYLGRFPAHVLFGQLKHEAELRRRRLFVDSLRKRSESQADLNSRVEVLEEGLDRYPDEEWIEDELRLTRNKLSLLNSAIEKARAAEAAGQWDDALELWNRVGAIHDQQPNLAAEIERVRRTRAQARADRIASQVRAIEAQIKAGDMAKAGELLRRAQSENPDEPALIELAKRLGEVTQKRNRAKTLISQARQVLDTDWRQAEALLTEAASLSFALPEDLTRAVEAAKRNAAVGNAVEEAGRLRQAGDLRAALALVDRAVATHGEDRRLTDLRDALGSEIRRRVDAILAELRSIERTAQTEGDPSRLQVLLQGASAIAAEPHGDTEITGISAAVVRNISARIRQARRDRLRNQILAQRKTMLVVAAALVLIVVGWFAVKAILSARAAAALVINAPPGLILRVGTAECTTPDCNLEFKPGTYTLTASRTGYETVTKTITVAQGQKQVEVAFDPGPLPQVVQVNANFENATVFIDGRQAGRLDNGQFTALDVQPGRHTIRVTGSGADFQADWRSAVAARPELTGPIVAKDVLTTVVANLGKDAAIACNCGAETVAVDGAPAGQTSASPGTLTPISHTSEGTREITIGGRQMVVELRSNPSLNIFLALDRNVGTLFVETGQAEAKVYLNNRFYRQTDGHGVLRMPLDTGNYSIRVEKDGYRAAPAQTVEVAKGEEKKVTFTLVPLPAVLEISGALAGAQVSIDRSVVGHISANGTFRTEAIQPGRHSIELASDGYNSTPVQEQIAVGKTVRIDGARFTMTKINRPPPPPRPADVEAQDWERVRNATSPDVLEGFAHRYPSGPHSEEARNRAAQIRRDAQRTADEAGWNAVDKTQKASLEDFTSHHPDSAHVAEARQMIARIERQEADAAAAAATAAVAQRERDRAAQEAARAAQDQEAVRRELASFEAAYNKRDLNALRTVWPAMPEETAKNTGKQFQFARSLVLQLQPQGPAAITGDSAVIDCDRRLALTPKDERREIKINERVRVMLGRSGSGWTIRAITPY